jgi:hypothetical protein
VCIIPTLLMTNAMLRQCSLLWVCGLSAFITLSVVGFTCLLHILRRIGSVRVTYIADSKQLALCNPLAAFTHANSRRRVLGNKSIRTIGTRVKMAGRQTHDDQNATEHSDDDHEVFLGDGANDRVLDDLEGSCCRVR